VFDVPNDATPAERAKFATEAVLNSAGAGSFSSAVGMANVTITVVSWD
jgi:hypothetical protein